MLRHLFKLTWKRKARNLMLSLEIVLAFAIVFGIAAFALRSWQLYHLPLGFEGDDVWSVELKPGDNGKLKLDAATYDAFARGVQELPEVERSGFLTFAPYSWSTFQIEVNGANGAKLATSILDASDDLAAVLHLRVAEGRWFSALDNGAAAQPVVLTRRMAQALFPGQSAVGHVFTDSAKDQKQSYKVVGVVEAYRGKGELMPQENLTFIRFAPGAIVKSGLPQNEFTASMGLTRDARTLLLRVKPGTDRSFETRLNRRLKAIRNDWTYDIAPLAAGRESALHTRFTTLTVLGTIAAFMLLMVAFGLFGVLWQNTTRRIPEIGLRRAIGARAADIYRQIVAEQLLLSSMAIAVGLLLLAQLPLTGALGDALDWTVFAGAGALSMAVIYLLSLACALYPGWRASRLAPAEALHYE